MVKFFWELAKARKDLEAKLCNSFTFILIFKFENVEFKVIR